MKFKKFSGKKILVTGHTGFKGSWLCAWLKLLGAEVMGIAIDPKAGPSHFIDSKISDGILDKRIDIRDIGSLREAFNSFKPNFVFHLAAQSLVRQSYENPVETWDVNLMGTVNILECLKSVDYPCCAVLVTSDKCYENQEWIWGYKETDRLGGIDPYSASKAAAEIAIHSYANSYFKNHQFVKVASARAGNVIGGGDWAVDRIVPDCMKSWNSGNNLLLRNPNSTRPWQYVLEPLSGYLLLALSLEEKYYFSGESYNFGPTDQVHSVLELVETMALKIVGAKWSVAKAASGNHEASLLKLNCDKAIHDLAWKPALNFEQTINMTVSWYEDYYKNSRNSHKKTDEQILEFTAHAKKGLVDWAL